MRFRSPFRPTRPASTPSAEAKRAATDGARLIEPAVRRVVAERLGVSAAELGADVSLRDDLAADSLDLVELILALESELAIEMPEGVVEHVRTYDDLVLATGRLLRARWAAACEAPTPVGVRGRFDRVRRGLSSPRPVPFETPAGVSPA